MNQMCIYIKDYNIYTSALKKARQKAGFFMRVFKLKFCLNLPILEV